MSVKGIVSYRGANASKVRSEDGITYPAILRKKLKRQRLFAGDYVEGEIIGEQFIIEKILPRKNLLTRPPVANVDNAFIVIPVKEPDFDSFLLDNFLAVYEYKKVEPIIVFNKIDLLEDKSKLQKWIDIYQNIGYKVLALSSFDKEAVQTLKNFIDGKIAILAGPSGAGKSSILSNLLGIELKTNDVSQKLKRGRHTTTAITLYPIANAYIADTPGFAKVEASYFMDRSEVRLYFREFLNYTCKFPDCTHTNEPGCAVKEAVKKGEIACERFRNYLKIMQYYWEELNPLCKEAE